MKKEEIRVLALQDKLKEAMKEWDEALQDVLSGKGKGVFGNPVEKREAEARKNVEKIKRMLTKAEAEAEAISDDEAEAIAETFVSTSPKSEDLSEDEERVVKSIAGI